MEARLQIEPALAALAAIRASADQVAMMRRLVKQREQRQRVTTEGADAIELWDSAFHRAIAEAAGNRLLFEIFEVIDAIRVDPTWRVLRERSRTAPLLHGYRRDHAAIVAAIGERDAPAAAAAMRNHLRTLQVALDETIHRDTIVPDPEPPLAREGRP
jgi:GntR family transcriptional regulator, transcriptional repressor for pyruvate dehydrogenase complex